jgi:hypothetical protein
MARVRVRKSTSSEADENRRKRDQQRIAAATPQGLNADQQFNLDELAAIRGRAIENARRIAAGLPAEPTAETPVAPMSTADNEAALEAGIMRALQMRVAQQSGNALRGQDFARHVMGPAFDAPRPAAGPDPAAQAAALAASQGSAATLDAATANNRVPLGSELVGLESKPRSKVVVRKQQPGQAMPVSRSGSRGEDPTALHIAAKLDQLRALQSGIPLSQLPQIPAIGQSTPEGAAREREAIASASDRREARRVKVSQSPQAAAVAQRGQDRAEQRAMRMRGPTVDQMAQSNIPPWLVREQMQTERTKMELENRTKNQESEQAHATKLAEQDAEWKGYKKPVPPGRPQVDTGSVAGVIAGMTPEGVPVEQMNAGGVGGALDQIPLQTIIADPQTALAELNASYGAAAVEDALQNAWTPNAPNSLSDWVGGERWKKLRALLIAQGRLRPDGTPNLSTYQQGPGFFDWLNPF